MAARANQLNRKIGHSNYGDALRDPAAHIFKPGLGYMNLGRMQSLPSHREPPDGCTPPPSTIDSTWHFLQPPNGGPPMNFRWFANQKTWFRRGGAKARRLGFTAEYLSRAGWTYKGPAKGPHS